MHITMTHLAFDRCDAIDFTLLRTLFVRSLFADSTTMAPRPTLLATAAAAAALLSSQGSDAFVVPSARAKVGSGVANLAAQQPFRRTSLPRVGRAVRSSALYSTSTDLPEIATMRAGEIKKELESYGISTKSFFEKSELVDALTQARAEGKTPIASSTTSSSTSTSTASTDGASRKKKKKVRSETAEDSAPPTGAEREKRIAEEMEKCQSMKAGELKAELQSLGVSTKSFFEKSEFVKALAEARVDGVKKTSVGGGAVDEEGYAEYKAADVEVLTDDRSGPRKKSRDGGSGGAGAGAGGPGAGGNPFGGGMPGGMPGGMGGMDMGNIADMLKNMGMGGAGGGAPKGANPFGGAGGSTPFGGANPFSGGMPGGMGGMGGMGDAMGKAQEMMKNPEVMKLMQEAQSNPRIMSAMTECMSNPAAMSKYINDPEIGTFSE